MVFAVTAAVVGGAIGKSNQKKAYERSKRDADLQKLIDGSSPSISAAEGVDAESFQVAGTEVADIDKAIEQSYYGGTPPSEEILAVPEEVPAEELAMLLQSNPELFQDQGIMGMASGGAVGTPEDVYYFGVPQIMGMMQDPNPQIQEVGMQLADQMATMPDAGMVPATANQIQSMAMGGAVTAKKFEEGGGTSTAQSIGEGFVSNLPIIAQINALKDVKEAEGLEKLVEGLDILPVNPVKLLRNIKARKELRAELRAEEQADREREEAIVFGPQSRANGGPITSERLNQLRRR